GLRGATSPPPRWRRHRDVARRGRPRQPRARRGSCRPPRHEPCNGLAREEGAMREMKAAKLMTPDPIIVERGTPISDVAREFREHDIGMVPVVESHADRRLLGVITDRDVAV